MESNSKDNQEKMWLKRIGAAGFLFFLVKGLIWLAVLFGVGKCFTA